MELKEITDLITAVSKSSLSEFSLEEGNLKLTLKAKNLSILENDFNTDTEKKSELKPKQEKNGITITSPLVGTFYDSPSPSAEPFVKVGDKVEKGQTIAIIEAMKLMNEIEAEYDGIVTDVLVENEAVVEYGQPLFVIS
ncbi:acetyl-CoA carboxylase biotin carboxyl carrier protein [Velocimicrobium porci]|uniref:Biotin carboxyl carrier protein of acetyl-CoA carboxylase n=1 Tax=Velocimicrobium porci TaxID=2606634 RepID=A0A6L5XWG4_9FIRM|nr:acetyl-CoA carboxylase biotin carboxyl carrier protein [Velocimicrobium porci]MSS62924.1 acetyl-CoA carboxylase biotin carboxyl carrier protein [Velocimicrobium porci]